MPEPHPSGPPPLTDAQRRRGLFFLTAAFAGVGFTMVLQMSLNSNFMVEQMRLSGLRQGVLESVRESCGIAALGLLALLAGLGESLIGAMMLVLLGAGLASYYWLSPSQFGLLIAVNLVWSQGLHVWMPLPHSMALALAEPGHAGRRLGQLGAAAAAGSAAGLAVAFALTHARAPIQVLYVIAGAAAVLAAAACLGIPRKLKPTVRMVLRRRYGLYYLLQFLEGWRKQICIAFAGFLLVQKYHTPLTTMLGLAAAVQAISWAAAPSIGRLIDRVGERKVLVFYYLSMAALFSGYGLVENKHLLWVLFVLDNAFFAFTMALTTYVNRIAPPQEHTPTLSAGVACNHVAAVIMPLTGGLLWKYAGYRWAFVTGIVAALVSAAVATRVPAREGQGAHKLVMAEQEAAAATGPTPAP